MPPASPASGPDRSRIDRSRPLVQRRARSAQGTKVQSTAKDSKGSPPDHDKNPWMRNTPRVEREARALRGYWPHFPVSPDPYAEPIERLFKPSGFYSEDQSFGLERKLSAFIERREAGASEAERCALYRAFLTVRPEQMGRLWFHLSGTAGLFRRPRFYRSAARRSNPANPMERVARA